MKKAHQKYLVAAILAGGMSALGGFRLTPYIKSILAAVMTEKEIVSFGQTLTQDDLATGMSYVATFLIILGLLLFLWREHHRKAAGKHHHWIRWVVLGTALLGALWFFWMKDAGISPVTKQQTGYKAEDRQKLEQLIHEGTQDD